MHALETAMQLASWFSSSETDYFTGYQYIHFLLLPTSSSSSPPLAAALRYTFPLGESAFSVLLACWVACWLHPALFPVPGTLSSLDKGSYFILLKIDFSSQHQSNDRHTEIPSHSEPPALISVLADRIMVSVPNKHFSFFRLKNAIHST